MTTPHRPPDDVEQQPLGPLAHSYPTTRPELDLPLVDAAGEDLITGLVEALEVRGTPSPDWPSCSASRPTVYRALERTHTNSGAAGAAA